VSTFGNPFSSKQVIISYR